MGKDNGLTGTDVASMYWLWIAANHFVDQINIDTERLDYGSASSESIDNHPHIHCWHTNNMFSKFQFTEETMITYILII